MYTTARSEWNWLRESYLSAYRLAVSARGEIYAAAAPIPLPSQEEGDRRVSTLEFGIDTKMLLSVVTAKPDLLLICAHVDKVSKLSFSVDGESQTTVTENLPLSLRKYPLFVEFDDLFLVRNYWIRDSESFTHSLMRQIISRIQIGVPQGLTNSSYSFTEADTYGKYIARYEVHQRNHILTGTKRRVRYLSVGQPSVSGRTRHVPNDQTHFTLETGKGLTSLNSKLRTSIELISRKIGEEEMNIKLEMISQKRLSSSYTKKMISIFSDGYRKVLPWEPLDTAPPDRLSR